MTMQQSTNIKMRAIALQKTTFWGLYEDRSLAADEVQIYWRPQPSCRRGADLLEAAAQLQTR